VDAGAVDGLVVVAIGEGVVMVISGSPMISRIILYAVGPLSLATCTTCSRSSEINKVSKLVSFIKA